LSGRPSDAHVLEAFLAEQFAADLSTNRPINGVNAPIVMNTAGIFFMLTSPVWIRATPRGQSISL
jgi:hypothetical protein